VQVGILEINKSEEVWKNPDDFNPDRFTLENAVEQNHNAFIPFSAGPRLVRGILYGELVTLDESVEKLQHSGTPQGLVHLNRTFSLLP